VKPEPYIGPRPFTLEDRSRFFGRQVEIDETVSLVMAHPVTLLYARSGVGKGSLVHAGLVPMLREEGLAVLPPARVDGVVPADIDPATLANPCVFHALSCWLDAQEVPFQKPEEVTDLRLGEFVEAWMKARPPALEDAAPVLIFEEIVSGYDSRGKERQEFFLQLADAIRQHPALKIVLTVREKFVAVLEPFAKGFACHLRVRKRLEPLTAAAALQAITGPVREFGVRYADGVAEKLVQDLLGMAGDDGGEAVPGEFVEPVQLQVVCRNLWEKLPGDFKTPAVPGAPPQLITHAHLAAAGEVGAALSNYYNDAIRTCVASPGIPEGALRRWFGETLISRDRRGLGMAVKDQNETAAIPAAAIRVLVEKYLIRHEKRGATEWYELAQARFIQPILDSNDAWLKQRAGAEAIRRELEHRAATLIRTGDNLKEWEIGQAENFLKSPEARELGDHEAIRALVRRSREQLDERRKARERELQQAAVADLQARRLEEQARSIARQRLLMAGLAVMVVIAFIGYLLAIKQSRWAQAESKIADQQRHLALAESKVAKARELAFRAVDVIPTDAELAVLLALHSYSVQPTSAGISALHQALVASPIRLRLAGQDGHAGSVMAAAYSRDGTRILTGGLDRSVRVWDAVTGAFGGTLGEPGQEHADWVWCIAFSPDGRRVATGGKDGTVRIWPFPKPATGPWPAPMILRHFDAENTPVTVHGIAFDPAGARLLACCHDGSAHIWDVASGGEIVRLTGHRGFVRGGAFSPTENLVVTAGQDNTARLWDLAPFPLTAPAGNAAPAILEPKLTLQPPSKDDQGFWSADFSPDGEWIVTAGGDHLARLWDVPTGQAITAIKGHDGAVIAAKFIDGKTVVTVSIDKTARLWSLREVTGMGFPASTSPADTESRSPVPMRHLTATPAGVFRGHTDYLRSVDVSPDRRHLVTSSRDGTARVWQMPPASEAAVVRSTHEVRDIAFSPDGRRLVTAASRTPVVWGLWTGTMGQPLLTLKGHTGEVKCVAWQADGKRIATAGDDGLAKLWDAATGRELQSFPPQGGAPIRGVAFAPGGRFLAIASIDHKAAIWDTETGGSLPLEGHQGVVHAVAFSPDGSQVLTTCFDRFARIYDRATGVLREAYLIKDDILLDGVFSPSGREIILACANGQAFILDAASGEIRERLTGHEGQVRRARYFEFQAAAGEPKQTGILTAGFDGTVRIWEASKVTGHWEQTTLLTGSAGPVYAVASSADGCQIATGSADCAARLYYRDGNWLLDLACTRVTRKLSAAEKLKYEIAD
jgi:WD40 repeat protein